MSGDKQHSKAFALTAILAYGRLKGKSYVFRRDTAKAQLLLLGVEFLRRGDFVFQDAVEHLGALGASSGQLGVILNK